jgi:hypothetical protein
MLTNPVSDNQIVLTIATALVQARSVGTALQQIGPVPGTTPASMRASLSIVMGQPPEQFGVSGPATLATARQNMLRRAQFVLSSARRITATASQGSSLESAAAAERTYFSQHLMALWNRAKAASQVDSAAGSYGEVLGWYTVRDRRTSAECRHANGKNFSVLAMPLIGWPGAVHPHCRCYPGRPYIGARMLPSAGISARTAVGVA